MVRFSFKKSAPTAISELLPLIGFDDGAEVSFMLTVSLIPPCNM